MSCFSVAPPGAGKATQILKQRRFRRYFTTLPRQAQSPPLPVGPPAFPLRGRCPSAHTGADEVSPPMCRNCRCPAVPVPLRPDPSPRRGRRLGDPPVDVCTPSPRSAPPPHRTSLRGSAHTAAAIRFFLPVRSPPPVSASQETHIPAQRTRCCKTPRGFLRGAFGVCACVTSVL